MFCGLHQAPGVASASAPAPLQASSAAVTVAQAPGANLARLSPATAPAPGPGQAVTAPMAPGMAPGLTAVSQASASGSSPAHTPTVVIAAPIAGGVALLLLLAAVAIARARLARKARQNGSESSRGSLSPISPGFESPLGAGTILRSFSDSSMALPKMPIRQAQMLPTCIGYFYQQLRQYTNSVSMFRNRLCSCSKKHFSLGNSNMVPGGPFSLMKMVTSSRLR